MKYLIEVERIAKSFFGSQVVPWDESNDECGVYGWDEVYAAWDGWRAAER
jgi:hypothetical protein